jgi:hypothetical protein
MMAALPSAPPIRCLALGVLLTSRWMLAAPPASQTPPDPALARLLSAVGTDAGRFWSGAPAYLGTETWTEYSTAAPHKPGKRRLHLRLPPNPPAESTVTRQIVSLYALAPMRRRAESLFEFRQVLSIDGKPAGDPAQLRQRFIGDLTSENDKRLHRLRDNFENQAMSGIIVDFGQLILLFTRPRQKQYDFELKPTEHIGALAAARIDFTQKTGDQGLHISEPGRDQEDTPLHGQIMVSPSDGAVLQIRLTADRKVDSHQIHDEAQVDYTHIAPHALVPVSVVHRRTEDGKTLYQDVFTYANWQPLGPPSHH